MYIFMFVCVKSLICYFFYRAQMKQNPFLQRMMLESNVLLQTIQILMNLRVQTQILPSLTQAARYGGVNTFFEHLHVFLHSSHFLPVVHSYKCKLYIFWTSESLTSESKPSFTTDQDRDSIQRLRRSKSIQVSTTDNIEKRLKVPYYAHFSSIFLFSDSI